MKFLINTTSPYTRIARIALWEKGFHDVEMTIVDPWGDTPALLEANAAARVPTLITDDGQILTESLLIVLWLESIRPQPSLLGGDAAGSLARAGIAMGVIDAAVHTLIGRKITGPEFDESPVGLRRRRTMIEALKRIDAAIGEQTEEAPSLDTISAIVALDYVRFRFPQAEWMPRLVRLDQLRQRFSARPSVERSAPY